jgi:hypothetical protein
MRTLIAGIVTGGGRRSARRTPGRRPAILGWAGLLAALSQIMAKLRTDASGRRVSYGFANDPRSPSDNRFYGYLGYAGGY